MILYHYTSIDKFKLIWSSKTIWFAPAETTNDFFERFKTFVLTQDTFKCDGKQLDRNRFDHFDEKIRAELSKYRQVSFSYDYDDGLKGYASPMMWGQYAWRKIDKNTGQNGVCIALDSYKIKVPSFVYKPDKISYTFSFEPPKVENIDYTQDDAAAQFVERNLKTYFYTKHKHWEHENEFRYICKQEGTLDISDAITGIYVLWDDCTLLDDIKLIVNDNALIKLLALDDFKRKEGEPYSLKEIYDLQNLMKLNI